MTPKSKITKFMLDVDTKCHRCGSKIRFIGGVMEVTPKGLRVGIYVRCVKDHGEEHFLV